MMVRSNSSKEEILFLLSLDRLEEVIWRESIVGEAEASECVGSDQENVEFGVFTFLGLFSIKIGETIEFLLTTDLLTELIERFLLVSDLGQTWH